MRARRLAPVLAVVPFLVLGTLGACGSAPPPEAASPGGSSSREGASSSGTAEPVASSPPAKGGPMPIPNECTKNGDVCIPESGFVERLCKSARTDAALSLFAKTSFTRGYLTRDTDAWNASGGGSSRDKVKFDEEVLVLRKREAGGIVVGQGGGWQVLRWDGSCVDLASEELTLKKPPKPKTPHIDWRNVESGARDALLANPKVQAIYDKRRKECKGATTGDVSLACVKADTALSEAIVEHVRSGGSLPAVSLP